MWLLWAVRVLAIKHFAVVLFLTVLPARRGEAILVASFKPVAVDLGIVLANNLNLGWGQDGWSAGAGSGCGRDK